MAVRGEVRCGRKTKDLVKRLGRGSIAVISHRDIDELAADSLIRAGPKAIINTRESISGRYPNPGPRELVEAGILLLDRAGEDLLEELEDGDFVSIDGGRIYRGQELIATAAVLDQKQVEARMKRARENLEGELDRFVENTLDYARREKGLILGWVKPPPLAAPIKDRQVLVVVRGSNYLEDLEAIRSYIVEEGPTLIAVDGGADALLSSGFTPHVIIGDMDSVSDRALRCGAELVVHAYPDGRSPGRTRLEELEIGGLTFRAPGTSEDIALLLAYEKGADLIVAVGTHSSMIDFLEKGRPGMASTFLVRLKVGEILVDAKGVSRLYRSRPQRSEISRLIVSALIPLLILVLISPILQQYMRLFLVWIRLIAGI